MKKLYVYTLSILLLGLLSGCSNTNVNNYVGGNLKNEEDTTNNTEPQISKLSTESQNESSSSDPRLSKTI